VIIQSDLFLEFLIGDGGLAVPATGHLQTLRVLTLLDVRAIFSPEEEGVPVGQEGPVVTSPCELLLNIFI
jgi:hypothetical protein